MDVITIDFETYYDKDYQLKKLTTEQYVRSDKFETILVSVKMNDEEVISCRGQDAPRFLRQYDFENSAVLAHNANFDGAILSWRYGRTAKLWLDTTAMARPFHGQTIGVSLRKLVEHYAVGDKGDAVYNAIGKRLADFSTEELAQYVEYNRTDVELTYKLFKKLRPRLPSSELLVINQTVRMFVEPILDLDVDVLAEHLKNVRDKKEMLLNSVGGEDFRKNIMSNDKFAEQLRLLGVEPPTKISAKTGKAAFAFAKTDKEFLALQEHEDEKVQTLVAARLGVKSTIEETRTEAFLDIATRGKLPVPLMYWGAHTGRFSGSDKINLQNLTRGGKLRDSIVAPPGKMLVVSDLSQIEARLLAYIAGQTDLVKAFAEGRDVYSEFASDIYDRVVTKEDKRERFVGKTCISEGTMVVTDSGLKPIETVTTTDRLWDGENWVCHEGLVSNGTRKTLNLCGTWLTPDHKIWSGTNWIKAEQLTHDESTLYRALAFAVANSPLPATTLDHGGLEGSSLSAIAQTKSTQLIYRTLKISNRLDAMLALRKRLLTNDTGCIQKLCRMMHTELDYLIDSPQQLHAAIQKHVGSMQRMAAEAYLFMKSGDTTEPRSLDTYKLFRDGITRLYKWTEQTMMGTTNPEILGLYPSQKMQATKDRSEKCSNELQSLKSVYDIANAGPKHRFFIYTNAGFMCVSNCILGLGYGTGPDKLKSTLGTGQGGISVDVDISEAVRIVGVYRSKNDKITTLWRKCQNAIASMARGESGAILEDVGVRYIGHRVLLPNDTPLTYTNLRYDGKNYVYDTRKGTVKIYGAKLVENIVQALAAIVIKEHMVAISKRYKLVLQVHDEIVCAVRETEVDEATEAVRKIMSTPPAWGIGLPIACEVGYAKRYGEAK